MSHPNETVLREAYDAFHRGDLEGYLSACTADFVFHIPGNNQAAGSYRGREGLVGVIQQVMQLTGGEYAETTEDVVANGDHGVILLTHNLKRDGRALTYRTAHVYEFREGKLAAGWEVPRDQVAFDEIWR